ncbi:peptidylprolyl isomerase [Candidatus Woesearchaeota archaeon]|nr:peptidylprolyl isomerase [Candidatus Woesearchaeota archaeon]
MSIKKGDFIELNYTGRTSDDGLVFDTTSQEVAKTSEAPTKRTTYEPIIVCVGEKQLIKGVDDSLIGKTLGKTYTIKLSAEEAFGKKDGKLLQLVSTSTFTKNQIKPFIGLEVNVDNMYGVIKSVTGGRTMVDFNHPLSGKDVEYEVTLLKKVVDDKQKIVSLITSLLNTPNPDVEVKEEKAIIKTEIPTPAKEFLEKKIKELIPKIKSVSFKA